MKASRKDNLRRKALNEELNTHSKRLFTPQMTITRDAFDWLEQFDLSVVQRRLICSKLENNVMGRCKFEHCETPCTCIDEFGIEYLINLILRYKCPKKNNL
jgi:hypothetical protein